MSPLPDPLVAGDPIAAVPQWTLDLRLALIGPGGLMEDTGWRPITVRSGYTTPITPEVRRIGKVLYFRGSISGPFAVNTSAAVADLPAGFIGPDSSRTVVTTGAYVGYANLSPSGALAFMFRSPYTGTSATVMLAGLSGITVD
ncbi:hypothetical protein [Cellulosimicrobium sp. I38E]|uniref:hypothetical protein n=1 Tax=Cellulosimicrobium sp. I38E TaxID=1393139 RepID=UPI0007B1BE39|nr:hypothetical protein [Cellulosimicrobium sp. I38E]KZM76631.1 hypothetical protein A0J59_20155 [Cellulosimicrobium sp. I38E]